MRWSTIGLCVAISVQAVAGEPDLVTVACEFTPQSVHRYQVDKITVQDRGQGATTRHERYAMTVTVISHDGAKSAVEVSYDDTELVAVDDPLYAKIIEAGNAVDVVLRLQVDHATTELQVTNLDEVLVAYGTVADATVALMRQNPAVPEQVVAATRAMMVDPTIVQNSLTGELTPLFQYNCGAFPRALQYESSVPNPFGGPALPAAGTITLQDGDGVWAFHVSERLNMQSALPLLRPVLSKMGVELPTDAEPALESIPIDLGWEMDLAVDRASGWPTALQSVRTTTAGPGRRTDTLSMTAITSPRPAP